MNFCSTVSLLSIIICIFFIIINLNYSLVLNDQRLNTKYSNILDLSVQGCLLEAYTNADNYNISTGQLDKVNMNKEKMLKKFMNLMLNNFYMIDADNIEDKNYEKLQNNISRNIPVFMVLDNDGINISVSDKEGKRSWFNKVPYVCLSKNIESKISMNDIITYNLNNIFETEYEHEKESEVEAPKESKQDSDRYKESLRNIINRQLASLNIDYEISSGCSEKNEISNKSVLIVLKYNSNFDKEKFIVNVNAYEERIS